MPLKHTVKTVIYVEYNDLESFIQEEFGHKDYSFVADMECSNDTCHTLHVGKWKLSEYDREDVEKYIETGEGIFITRRLLDHLYEQGKLEAGEYLISVSW